MAYCQVYLIRTVYFSVLASFHYGNLTHPSVDPPRVGFISTVPRDSEDVFAAAIKSAHNNFPGERILISREDPG